MTLEGVDEVIGRGRFVEVARVVPAIFPATRQACRAKRWHRGLTAQGAEDRNG